MDGGVPKSPQGALPPWLWFWLGASLLLTFRAGPASWLGEGVVLFTGYPEIGTQVSLFRVVGIAFVLPVAVVFAGLVTIVLPWVRAAYLVRRYGLAEPPESPRLKEISSFVHAHDPDLKIKVNLARPNQLVFVYPIGYRKAAMAVFGGLIILWSQDRKTAESILLHEIGHRRHGDVLVVGAGSLLTAFVRYGLLAGAIGLAVGFAALSIRIIGSVPDNLGEVLYMVRVALLYPLVVAVVVATPILILPLVGMWCAEFNADRFALEAQGSHDAMVNAVDRLRPPKSRFRWLLLWMTHPPDTLRRWAVRRHDKKGTLVALLLLFPAAALIGVLCQIVWDTYLFSDTAAWLNAADTRLDPFVEYWLAIAGDPVVAFCRGSVGTGVQRRAFRGRSLRVVQVQRVPLQLRPPGRTCRPVPCGIPECGSATRTPSCRRVLDHLLRPRLFLPCRRRLGGCEARRHARPVAVWKGKFGRDPVSKRRGQPPGFL